MKNDEDHIWYLGYGSNLSRQRFLCYIKGGTPTYGKKHHRGCGNKAQPVDDRPFRIPHRLYFALPEGGKGTSNWGPGGVAFIDPEKETREECWTWGRMWRITGKQYEEVRGQEGRTWYDHEILLGNADGIPIYTITNSNALTNIMAPSETYLKTIAEGLVETCGMTDREIVEYLQEKAGIRDRIPMDELVRIMEEATSAGRD